MKICHKCHVFFQAGVLICQYCQGDLFEVSLTEALKLTQKNSLKSNIGGKTSRPLTDRYKQYHIRSYLQNRSLFLDYDLYKNRLKHGRRLKKFFIAPVNITSIVNIPWFLFNVVASNIFHLTYTHHCPHCDCKCIPGQHGQNECDYNIEYFNILDDIISGGIADRKWIYEEYAKFKRKQGLKTAYDDLFERKVHWEIFWDLLSIGSSVAFWLYLSVYVSFPWFKVLAQKLSNMEDYIFILSN